ncbi:hypothetical protein JCM1840_005632 [Sporobolomyces johnsonii]
MHAVADVCIVPMGTEASVSKYIAETQRVLERTGLKYQLHGYGTGIEGEFSDVMKAIEKCHEALHKMGCPRLASGHVNHPADIRIGTRTDKQGSLDAKVASVQEILAGGKPPAPQEPPSEIELPPQPLDPRAELERKITETKTFLASPLFEAPGKDV